MQVKAHPESLLSSGFGQEMLFNTINLAERGFLLSREQSYKPNSIKAYGLEAELMLLVL